MAENKDRTGPQDLGLDLSDGDEKQAFKWLVACLLFGTRIKQELAADAFRVLDEDGLTTPQKLAKAEWQHLVDLLGESHYKRYDESKARELIQLGQDTLDRYDGHLSRLADGAKTKKELAKRLQEFKGIGPTAADIFLREMASHWRG